MFVVCSTVNIGITLFYLFSDFSLTQFLEEQGAALSDQLSSAVTQTLLSRLGLPEFLLANPCDRTQQPFTNGWKNGQSDLDQINK